jgi:cytochrome c biogenesis protein
LKSLIRFLSSVRLAIVLFILVTAASVLGTLTARVNLFRTPAYLSLLLLFSINLLVCTLNRALPRLWRAAKPPLDWTAAGLAADPESHSIGLNRDLNSAASALRAALTARRYRVREARAEGAVRLLARKRTLGGFGADVVHLGVLAVLAGGVLSGVLGRKADLVLIPGRPADVLSAGFQVRLEEFLTERYPDGAVKDWKSRLTVLEAGTPVLTRTVEVNHPLSHRGVRLYQSSYGWNWDEARLLLRAGKRDDPSFERSVELRVGGEADIPGTDARVAALRFVPDFVLDGRNEVQTRSFEPNNPAVLVEVRAAGRTILTGWLFANYPEFNRVRETEATNLSLGLGEVRADQFSVLQAASDPGVPLIWLGCAILMLGLGLAFYWPPLEIRAAVEVRQGKAGAVLAGRAPKAREVLRADIESAAAAVRARKERS